MDLVLTSTVSQPSVSMMDVLLMIGTVIDINAKEELRTQGPRTRVVFEYSSMPSYDAVDRLNVLLITVEVYSRVGYKFEGYPVPSSPR